MGFSCGQHYCTQSVPYLSWKCMRTMSLASCGMWYFFPSQHQSNFFVNMTFENGSQIATKRCKIGSFICKVNLNFLSSSRQFNCDTAFTVSVFLLNGNVQSLNNVCIGRVKAGLQIINVWWLRIFFFQKTRTVPEWHFGTMMVGFLRNWKLQLSFQIQLLQ